jgi:hypothetical protein
MGSSWNREEGWIHYDTGQNNSIGTGSANDFDVYIRFPAATLTQYSDMSLYALKVWPAQAGTFSVRVWTGGTSAAPANMIVDQGFTPVLATYNTVILNNPVLVTGAEELWFGYRNVVTNGYPSGCDAGPAVDGFGNMMYFDMLGPLYLLRILTSITTGIFKVMWVGLHLQLLLL